MPPYLRVLTTAGSLGWVERFERQKGAEGGRKKPDGTIPGSRLAQGFSTYEVHGRRRGADDSQVRHAKFRNQIAHMHK